MPEYDDRVKEWIILSDNRFPHPFTSDMLRKFGTNAEFTPGYYYICLVHRCVPQHTDDIIFR
eukprot:10639442-Karenia_brevis.AAC.1